MAKTLKMGAVAQVAALVEQPSRASVAAAAVAEFKAAHGRQWKRKLLALWESGRDTGDLRVARNVIGPSGLRSIG